MFCRCFLDSDQQIVTKVLADILLSIPSNILTLFLLIYFKMVYLQWLAYAVIVISQILRQKNRMFFWQNCNQCFFRSSYEILYGILGFCFLRFISKYVLSQLLRVYNYMNRVNEQFFFHHMRENLYIQLCAFLHNNTCRFYRICAYWVYIVPQIIRNPLIFLCHPVHSVDILTSVFR